MFAAVVHTKLGDSNLVLKIEKRKEGVKLTSFEGLAQALQNGINVNVASLNNERYSSRRPIKDVTVFWQEMNTETTYPDLLVFFIKNPDKMDKLREKYSDVNEKNQHPSRIIRSIRTYFSAASVEDAEKFYNEVLSNE